MVAEHGHDLLGDCLDCRGGTRIPEDVVHVIDDDLWILVGKHLRGDLRRHSSSLQRTGGVIRAYARDALHDLRRDCTLRA